MHPPKPWSARLLSAALGVICGCLVGGAILSFRESVVPNPVSKSNSDRGIARPASLTATRSRNDGSLVERELAVAESIMKEHPDALPISRDEASRFVGDRMFALMGGKLDREGPNPLRLSEEEMEGIDRCLTESYGEIQKVEAAVAQLVSKTEEEMVFQIPARGVEREKVLRDFRRKVRKQIGPLRGDIIADYQERQPLLGHSLDVRRHTIKRPVNNMFSMVLIGTTPPGSPEAGAVWNWRWTASLESYPELIPSFTHLIDFDTWEEKEGITQP